VNFVKKLIVLMKRQKNYTKQQIDVLIESIQFRLYMLSKDKGEYKR
jgi:hypothetical protein